MAAPLSSPDDAGVVALDASSRSARTARTSRAAAMASSFGPGKDSGRSRFASPAIPRQQLAMAPRAFLLQHTQMQQQPSSTRPPKPTKE